MARFGHITEQHPVEGFRCGNTDLDAWLTEAAINSDRSGTARVYIWLDDPSEVIGYFAQGYLVQ